MKIEDIIYSSELTGETFKILTSDHSENILFNDFEDNIFKQAILVKLDNIPVMIASCETSVNNDVFLNLLKHNSNQSVNFYANKTGIRRRKMTVTQTNSDILSDSLISNYVKAMGIGSDLYVRKSTFSCNKQTMELKEYILPGLKFVVNKHAH